MKGFAILLVIVVLLGGLFFLTSPRKAVGPSAPASGAAVSSSSPKTPDAVREKLMDYAGAGATDCGRLSVQATIDQSKTASDCATQANQGKHAFYVAYDMPGMAIGIAGNAAGKLFTVQSQGSGSSGALSSGDCPSQLRVAGADGLPALPLATWARWRVVTPPDPCRRGCRILTGARQVRTALPSPSRISLAT